MCCFLLWINLAFAVVHSSGSWPCPMWLLGRTCSGMISPCCFSVLGLEAHLYSCHDLNGLVLWLLLYTLFCFPLQHEGHSSCWSRPMQSRSEALLPFCPLFIWELLTLWLRFVYCLPAVTIDKVTVDFWAQRQNCKFDFIFVYQDWVYFMGEKHYFLCVFPTCKAFFFTVLYWNVWNSRMSNYQNFMPLIVFISRR